ncbi:MAG: hypothetical protein LC647_00960 [Beggiatoa sp.]|nr:hypothetical protein [Beggiatoa sp.]
MSSTEIIIAIAIAIAMASLCHALALKIATKLMVEVPVKYGKAYLIVLIEYLAVGGVVAGLWFADIGGLTPAIIAAAFTYLLVGAACIGTAIPGIDGARLGVGNGVLIQAIQVPIIVPFLILGSFLRDLLAISGV